MPTDGSIGTARGSSFPVVFRTEAYRTVLRLFSGVLPLYGYRPGEHQLFSLRLPVLFYLHRLQALEIVHFCWPLAH